MRWIRNKLSLYANALWSARRRTKRVACVLCLVLAVGFFVFFFRAQHVVHSVVRTNDGFKPEKLLIRKGDTVRFINESSANFWPASDSHPSHGLYAAFDAGRPIPPGDEWTFQFKRVGAWSFHDHLSSHVAGRILVHGSSNDTAECLQEQDWTIQPQCWETAVTQLIAEEGFSAVFDVIREWYAESPDFQRNCHDVMHIVGEAAYAQFLEDKQVTERPEVVYCGYGFFHGFVETMLVEDGAHSYERATEYCELVRDTRSVWNSGPCYHGIGHAIFDSLEGSLWGDARRMANAAHAVCERISEGVYERVRCSSGIFNALANAMSARAYELTYDNSVAYELCAAYQPAYHRFCYFELGNGQIRDQHWSRAQEIAFINAIHDARARSYVAEGYMSTEVWRFIDTLQPAAFADICNEFWNTDDKRACVRGVVTGLKTIGEPGREQEKVDAFCAALPTSLSASCVLPPGY